MVHITFRLAGCMVLMYISVLNTYKYRSNKQYHSVFLRHKYILQQVDIWGLWYAPSTKPMDRATELHDVNVSTDWQS